MMIDNIMRTYLKIENLPDGKIDISAADGVFSYIATCSDKDDFINYCEKRKEAWLNSNLGNFNGLSKFKRQIIANKWDLVKELSDGYYNYYFNLESVETIFRNEVENLANSLGIKNYVLETYE